MTKDEAKEKYEQLFPDEKAKAKAFDKIAEKYYFVNFGSTTKSDFDVLMFSLYIEQILANNQSDYSAYSDYTLSKLLGLTQTKISNLKVKKELLYPHEGFDWKTSLLEISQNAIYEKNQIKLYIPDKNLFLEIKNAIESAGGFIEIQLTQNLLQVNIAYFLDLLISIGDNINREAIRDKLKENTEFNEQDLKLIEKQPIGQILKSKAPDIIIDLIGECIPIFGGVTKSIAKNIINAVRESPGH